MTKFYITSAIPYVNAKPHIGQALEYCQTDVIARFHRLMADDTYFMMGADENGLKNAQAAEKAGKSTGEFVKELTQVFIDLNKALNISNDYFIKTTSSKHFDGAQRLWQACSANGDIYKKKYKGLYCIGCEEFKKESDLTDGFCEEHYGIKLEVIEEENYFFKLTKYQQKLEDLINEGQLKIIPETRKNEVLSFIKMGLEDFSISRTKERAKGWGVPVPEDDDHVMYVWFDALANYITALNYGKNGELFNKYWVNNENILHVIGKGIVKFHAVYWPAFLMSANIMPQKLDILVHGYFTVEKRKMSKTLGNVIDPMDLINKYGNDATRYILLKTISTTGDGDFSFALVDEVYNSDLAKGIGNFSSRVLKMIEKYNKGIIPDTKNGFGIIAAQNFEEFNKNTAEFWILYQELFSQFKFDKILQEINQKLVAFGDKYIDVVKPWELEKEEKIDSINIVLYNLGEQLRQISMAIYPFLPQTANNIRTQLGINEVVEKDFNFTKEIKWSGLKEGVKIGEIKPLFPRIEN